MQRKTKQILGCVGLGIVTAITAVAIALPANHASAVGGGDVKLNVEVHNLASSVVIQSPLDGAEFTTNNIPITNLYSKTAVIHYQLAYIDSLGNRTDYNLPDYIASTSGTADGTHSWVLDLNNYGGQYGQYILTATAGAVSDYVSFLYKSVGFGGSTTDPDTGNPVISVNYTDDVCSLKFQATHKVTGATLFNPEYTYTIPTPRPVPNHVEVELPFDFHNASAGDYSITVKGYGCGNNQNDQIGDEDDGDTNYQPTDDITKTPEGDPIVKVRFDFPVEVCVIKFQATHKTTGAALFHPEFEHLLNPPMKSGVIKVHLPFAQYGAQSGDYNIVASFYDCSGNKLGNDVDYDFNGYVSPVAPGVPDTGGGIFAGLNFSRKDYLITGIVVFMLALIIAVRMMAKNRKSGRR